MLVNGKKVEYAAITLLDYLEREGFSPAYVVVEKNREIITKERFGEVTLGEGDEINILRFMGGG